MMQHQQPSTARIAGNQLTPASTTCCVAPAVLYPPAAAAVQLQRFSQRIQQPSSRFPLQPAKPAEADLPAAAPYQRLPAVQNVKHRALAERVAAANAAANAAAAGGGQAASRERPQQQQRQRRHLPRNGNVWSVDLAADVAAVCKEVGLGREVAGALAAAAAAGQVSANPGVLLSQVRHV